MSKEDFDYIHARIEAHLLPIRNVRPDVIKTHEKLAMVIEFLKSGSSQKTIAALYRVSPASMSNAIDQVCNAICKELMNAAFEKFDCNSWLHVANRFNEKWNLPNCLGAIDGKHIRLKCPRLGASMFFNFKVYKIENRSRAFGEFYGHLTN